MQRPGRPVLVLLALGAVAVVVAGIVGGWWLGTRQALTGLAFEDVTADVAATAMQQDHFYADFGRRVLIVHGSVASVDEARTGTVIILRTEGTTRLTCVVPSDAQPPDPGQDIRLVAIGGSALREPDGLRFPDCRVLTVP
jgi:hypothetical protein